MNGATIHAALGKLRRRQQFPSANNGQSFLGPHGALTAAADSQVYFCVRVVYIADDPNSNGGLDSEGRYKAYIESNLFAFGSTPAPEVRVSANKLSSGADDGNLVMLSAGASVWCYAYGITQGSSDSTDDGFTLMMPIAAYNPMQAMMVSGPSFSAAGDVVEWDGGVFDSAVPFATTDQKHYTIPDNGLYLSIFSVTFGSSFGFSTAAIVNALFNMTLDGTVVARQSGMTGTLKIPTSATSTLSGGPPPTACSTTLNTTDFNFGNCSLTIPMLFAGQQGKAISCVLETISVVSGSLPSPSVASNYGQWVIARIGDTGTPTSEGKIPVPPAPP